MQLTIQVAVSSDDGKIGQNVVAKLMLATGVYGTDAGVAKQDFLQQAENLVRTVAENQIPALYDAVQKQINGTGTQQDDEMQAKAKARAKLKSIHDKRAQQKNKQEDKDEQPVQQEDSQTQEEEQ